MARVYMITEVEMMSLLSGLELVEMRRKNHICHPNEQLEPEEQNRLDNVHRAFHFEVVRWAQAVGFDGYRK